MMEELAKKLEIAERMPLHRQRDVADTLRRIIESTPQRFREAVECQAQLDEADPIEFPPEFFDNLPEELAVQIIEREPIYNSTEIAEELVHSINLLAEVDADRQRFAARMIGEIMRQDRFEVILSLEQEQKLKELVKRIDRGEE